MRCEVFPYTISSAYKPVIMPSSQLISHGDIHLPLVPNTLKHPCVGCPPTLLPIPAWSSDDLSDKYIALSLHTVYDWRTQQRQSCPDKYLQGVP